MTLRSFPITPTFQFTQTGKPLYLQNPNLFNLLFELWRRLGGEAETPDLTAMESNISQLFELVADTQTALASLAEQLTSAELDLNDRIDATNVDLAAGDNQLYDVITDTQAAMGSVSDQLAQAENDIDDMNSLAQGLASAQDIEALLGLMDDMNAALAAVSDQAFQATT